MRFTQLLMAFALIFAASAMARENKFFCREYRTGEMGGSQLPIERSIDFKDNESRFECKDVDDKSPFCCKYTDSDVSAPT
ncbi:hypothetical protein BDZ45DRAFT_740159 [Acephala macrosclerotiorum]|nr:hypothetical protein BDZ45DRAFT_740159 [Acephala macrosclerotiorum]